MTDEYFQPKEPKRSMYWVTEFYPDSLDFETVVDRIQNLHISAFISPLHDKDVNPTGEPKKPHYHVVLNCDSQKSYQQVKEYVDYIGSVGCFYCTTFRGYSRYLCHLDNPEKYQYDINDVFQIGDTNYFDVISSASDLIQLMGEICEFCYNFEIFDFSYIVLWSYHHNKLDWLQTLRNQALFFRTYLQSLKYSYDSCGLLPDYSWNVEEDQERVKLLRKKEKEVESARMALMLGGKD